MAIKKSDIYSSLWASCDELRGGMDAIPIDHPWTLFFQGPVLAKNGSPLRSAIWFRRSKAF